ncbi:MAG: hypothetical protein ACK4NE_03835 [Albidovulum sp.]
MARTAGLKGPVDAIGEIGRKATVVFVTNHRSNMDCVLVTWLAADRSALSCAVGETVLRGGRNGAGLDPFPADPRVWGHLHPAQVG